MKRLRFSFPVLFLVACLVSGCAPAVQQPGRSTLQVRAIQTRQYEVSDSRLVMKALLNVLQDDGFVTKNAVVDLGLITATKELERNAWTSSGWAVVLMGPDAVWDKTEVVEATANVSEFGKEVRVRISFQRKVLDNHGNVSRIEDLSDAGYYQDFLAKVDKAIFIQKERI